MQRVERRQIAFAGHTEGVAHAVADRLGVPIMFAGVGEEVDALAPFEPEAFVEWLFAE